MPIATPGMVEALGQSDAFLAFMEQVAAAARADRPALLVGERGTGKELAAARLHFHSPRWERPFVTVNLAALPRTLLEAELFGHEAGAFTGAARRRPGRFEAADRGTLFLDELQAAPRAVQEKLLRVLEYGVFERLGASDSLAVDVRIVAAVNRDPRDLVRRGRLLPDLLDRLAFAVLHVPPLRCRHGDIPYLAERFAARFSAELGRDAAPSFAPSALAALDSHPWPGNVRELKNVVERAVFETSSPTITHVVLDPFAHPFAPPPLPPHPGGPGGMIPPGGSRAEPWPPEASSLSPPSPSLLPWTTAVTAFETDLLRRALDRAGGNQRRAAQALGLTYHQFRGLYRKYASRLETGGPDGADGLDAGRDPS